MMKFYVLPIAAVLWMASMVLGQDSSLVVEELHICTAIEERAPVNSDTLFNSIVGQLYCFTKITGAETDQSVFHVWYFNEKEMARIELGVKGKTWRTWSSKKIMEDWTGSWKVVVIDEKDQVLKQAGFTIQ